MPQLDFSDEQKDVLLIIMNKEEWDYSTINEIVAWRNYRIMLSSLSKLQILKRSCSQYWNPNDYRSGTGQTVRMTQRKEFRVINLF